MPGADDQPCCALVCRDPERGWDHSRVKGVVAKLVRVKDPATATALEVAAGGRLYQVRTEACCISGLPCLAHQSQVQPCQHCLWDAVNGMQEALRC